MEKKLFFPKAKENKNVKNYTFFVVYDTRRKRTLKWCIIQGKLYGGEEQ